MRRIISLSVLLLVITSAFAQMVDPPKLNYSFSKTDVKVGDEVELVITGQPPKDWYVYSTNVVCEVGPIKASVSFKQNPAFKLVGSLKSVGDKILQDDIFMCQVGKFYHDIHFRQKIKILAPISNISGTLEGQMCTDATGQCVPLENIKMEFKGLKVSGDAIVPAEPLPSDTPEAVPAAVDTAKQTDTASKASSTPHYKLSGPNDNAACQPKTFSLKNQQEEKPGDNLFSFFILAFLSGLAALITPCVFPMIPMTVSFFLKENSSRAAAIRKGVLYGLSIIFIYTILGTLVAFLFGSDVNNWLSTHWIPNVLFFVIFVIFAISFFGAFEIVLPAWVVNKADQQSERGGLAGIFFMAFTIVLVSFSCTGPIVGTVLVESSKGGFLLPIIGMFGFSLAFALPFALFAIFPNWLQNLPKSGGWLNSVKVCLGFIELALGLKFLSVADQTYHWRILDREVYLALWIVIFTLMGLYLLGKLKFSHDSDMPYLKVPRLFFAILTFSFVAYMIPGMWGAPLKALAGYMPPMTTQDFNIPGSIREAAGVPDALCDKPKYDGELHIPHNIPGYFDYDQAVACAKEKKKPVFLDFTGHGCVNCRKMEEMVWSDPKVLKMLNEEFIVASLYVDDKKIQLPKEEWFTGRYSGQEIRTLGKKNTEIQRCYFNSNSQPQYIILDGNENMLASSYSTEGFSVPKFQAFLDGALQEFRKRNPK